MPRIIVKDTGHNGWVRGSRDLTDHEVEEIIESMQHTEVLVLPMAASQTWIFGKNVVANSIIEVDHAWTGEASQPPQEEKK